MTDLERITDAGRTAPQRFDLAGKVAVVVGGNKGLGQAMALALAGAGADVCIVARGPAGLEETAETIRSYGRRGEFVAADVSDETVVVALTQTIIERLGTVDILINSQGIVHLQPIAEFDTEQWQKVMDINVKSVFFTCKHFGRIMLAKGKGKIINVSSVRGFQGRAEDAAYAPSKGAVNQLTRSLAIEWGPHGVNVNGIAPVFTLTAISRPVLDDPAKRDWVLGRIPMKRLGELEDVMGPALFLSSSASDFVNGHTLPVDGGWLGA